MKIKSHPIKNNVIKLNDISGMKRKEIISNIHFDGPCDYNIKYDIFGGYITELKFDTMKDIIEFKMKHGDKRLDKI